MPNDPVYEAYKAEYIEQLLLQQRKHAQQEEDRWKVYMDSERERYALSAAQQRLRDTRTNRDRPNEDLAATSARLEEERAAKVKAEEEASAKQILVNRDFAAHFPQILQA